MRVDITIEQLAETILGLNKEEKDKLMEILWPKYDHWQDHVFLAEMNRRMSELEDGTVKGIPWEEVKRNAKDITG